MKPLQPPVATPRIVLATMAIAAAVCLATPSPANAQSADLVLCDRLAADPADPDSPPTSRAHPISRPPISRPRSNIAKLPQARRGARFINWVAPTPPTGR